jgi:hypothetical protein
VSIKEERDSPTCAVHRRPRSVLALAFVAASLLGSVAAAAEPLAKSGDVIFEVGDRKLTQAELQAQLGFEPEPLLQRMREDNNFARVYAVRWFHAEIFAKAARDDGLVAKTPGLAGAADNLGRNLIAREYQDHLLEVEYKPTDNEIQQYYTFNKELCTTPARYHIARAGVQIAKHASPEEIAAAQKRLAEIEARLKKGDAFATVADELSDLPSKGPGGDSGWLTDDDLAKDEQSGWIKELAAGSVSEPKKTIRGTEIYLMMEKEPSRVKTAAECRPEIETRIKREYYKKVSEGRADELAKRFKASMNLDAFIAAARAAKGIGVAPDAEQAER